MKKTLQLLVLSLIVLACNSHEPLSPQAIEKEKEAVIEVLQIYNKAFEAKDFAGLLPTLSQEVNFFGTDSAEVITSLNEFKKKITQQFNDVDELKYGPMTDIFIQMDPYGNFANIMYGQKVTVSIKGSIQHMFIRGSRTLKKEKGNWVIVSGIIGVAGGTFATNTDSLNSQ